jgi:hypothetical protein
VAASISCLFGVAGWCDFLLADAGEALLAIKSATIAKRKTVFTQTDRNARQQRLSDGVLKIGHEKENAPFVHPQAKHKGALETNETKF